MPFHSIICIPTGGGKTRLAVVFLINQVLSNKKILWVTHSRYLLDQAYTEFARNLGMEWMQSNAILIYSGSGNRIADITSSHRLVFVSFQSLSQSCVNWKERLVSETVVIVDEAHHIVANSYRKAVDEFSVDKVTLGLSATPIRTKQMEKNQLYQFFNTDLGVQVHMTTLFQQGILVRPIFEEVYYEIDDTTISSINDIENRLVKNISNYNQLILDRYTQYEEKYGKTIIFALNIDHAKSLYRVFQERYGDNVFLIYSDSPSRESEFNKFQISKNGILININIMNEGVDIPDIRTVFMTKPLNSQIQVTQMVGRALRKPKNIPKEYANVVNFAVSNLGKKILLVSPKLTYKGYEAAWQEEEDKWDILALSERKINAISELVDEVRKKKAVCTFSDIFLAGYYSMVMSDEQDALIPVTYTEYRKIERYRASGEQAVFPQKMFFQDDVPSVKACFDKHLSGNVGNNTTEIVFFKFDEELLDALDGVMEQLYHIYDIVKVERKTLKEWNQYLAALYRDLPATVLYYLNLIGAKREDLFIKLVRSQYW